MSSVMARVGSLWERLRRRRSPFREVMPRHSYRKVLATPALHEGQAELLGQRIFFSDREGFIHSVREIFYDEVYRFTTTDVAPLIVDAGANIGLSVLYFKRLYPEATIIAYEPDPTIFELLQRNTAHLNKIELHNAAAWIEDGTLTFYSEGSLAGSSEIDFAGKGNAITVAAERLKTHLAGRRVDFLKLDVEGAEHALLPDIADELASVDRLFWEYHSSPDSAQQLGTLLNLVAERGFRYAINGCHAPRLPFIERFPHGFDLQLNISCFRPEQPSAEA